MEGCVCWSVVLNFKNIETRHGIFCDGALSRYRTVSIQDTCYSGRTLSKDGAFWYAEREGSCQERAKFFVAISDATLWLSLAWHAGTKRPNERILSGRPTAVLSQEIPVQDCVVLPPTYEMLRTYVVSDVLSLNAYESTERCRQQVSWRVVANVNEYRTR
jgi:hypothetical protein